jgi:hypothetical protein
MSERLRQAALAELRSDEYLCIDCDGGSTRRIDAQFPPFGPRTGNRSQREWRVIYQAPGVRDTLLAGRG